MYRPPVTILQALVAIDSSKSWSVRNNSYDSISCVGENETTIPTQEEIEIKINELIVDRKWEEFRMKRNRLLRETDIYSSGDYPHPTEEAKQAWFDYRQALRDLPANTTDPENPVWPTAPN